MTTGDPMCPIHNRLLPCGLCGGDVVERRINMSTEAALLREQLGLVTKERDDQRDENARLMTLLGGALKAVEALDARVAVLRVAILRFIPFPVSGLVPGATVTGFDTQGGAELAAYALNSNPEGRSKLTWTSAHQVGTRWCVLDQGEAFRSTHLSVSDLGVAPTQIANMQAELKRLRSVYDAALRWDDRECSGEHDTCLQTVAEHDASCEMERAEGALRAAITAAVTEGPHHV